MKKLIIASSIAIALSITATNASAELQPSSEVKNPKEITQIKQAEKNKELIGFGSGAVAGAIVGGPLGAVVGGIFGIFIAEDVNSDAELNRSKAQLAQAEHSLAQQQQSLVALQTELQDLQALQLVQLVSYEQENNSDWINDLSRFESNLQFKTASFKIEDTYKEQLNSLANILTTYPQLSVKITGFADQRGDSDYNQQLSQQRAEAVATYLSKENVAVKQIKIVAAGEEITFLDSNTLEPIELTAKGLAGDSSAMTQAQATPNINLEDLFFSRRVNISLITPKDQMTAAN